jgi:glutathione synthase/RimK-type ligase-like ATP-grasp enzyme
VLIVCGPGDEHALSVALRLAEMGARPVRVDLARLPATGLAVRLGGGRAARVMLGTDEGLVDPATCAATWWRRPSAVELAAGERRLSSEARRLGEAEWAAALAGLVRVVGGTWVNDPGAEELARRKLAQLEAARLVGLSVPRTLVTNDLALARSFIPTCRSGAVLKSLSSVAEGGLTRRVRVDDEDLPARLRAGPAILQERIAGRDLRVTIVGDAVFAMSLDARAGGDPDDVRASWARVCASARPERLPPELVRRLLALQRRLGLRFGAVDLRRRRGGDYAFLEVNPSGQWLHAEAATGHPIGATLARLLASGRASRGSRSRVDAVYDGRVRSASPRCPGAIGPTGGSAEIGSEEARSRRAPSRNGKARSSTPAAAT